MNHLKQLLGIWEGNFNFFHGKDVVKRRRFLCTMVELLVVSGDPPSLWTRLKHLIP